MYKKIMKTIIYAPSATGRVNYEEINALEGAGFRVVIWEAPYLKYEEFNTVDEIRLAWVLYEYSFKKLFREIKSQTYHRLFAMGLNLGGAVLSYVSRGLNLDGLIIAGAVPKLSEFWCTSAHSQARHFQAMVRFDKGEYQLKLQNTDLIDSIKSYPKDKLLVQVGLRDDWIDEPGRQHYYQMAQQGIKISWHNDVHSMAGQEAKLERMNWLVSKTGAPILVI